MKNSSESREVSITNLPVRQEEPEQAARELIQTILRLGVNLISVPLVILPAESRTHMEAAGREFARGLIVLARELAKSVEQIAQPSTKDKAEPANKS